MQWEYTIDVNELCTPIAECVCIETGLIDSTIIDTLEKNDFDYAPVTDRGRVIGLIETSQARSMLDAGLELSSSDQAITHTEIRREIPIELLLDEMSRMLAALVTEVDGGDRARGTKILGLMTIADLNRQPLRTVLYRILARLEDGLARLISRHFSDPWTWLMALREDHQASLIGYWELSKRRGVDIGPIAATTLTQLLAVAQKSKDLRSALGFETGTSFEKCSGAIPGLRNQVMHPVRPLILAGKDVLDVKATVRSIAELGTRVETLIEQMPGVVATELGIPTA
jgi:hypothetical protein